MQRVFVASSTGQQLMTCTPARARMLLRGRKAAVLSVSVSPGNQVKLDLRMRVSQVKATVHGSRQMCRMDRFGFAGTSAKAAREVKVFRTGDMVQSVVP